MTASPLPYLSDAEILHIAVELMNGRGRHGEFLTSLAEAIVRADTRNFEIVAPAFVLIVDKYDLRKYLDTLEGREATS